MALLIVVVALAAGAGLLFCVYRPWHLRWGATREEIARAMPSDGELFASSFTATRAITVRARPEHVWPWLVQIGFGRAGWYSYDWLDNLGKPSAESIIPELQTILGGLARAHRRGVHARRRVSPGPGSTAGPEQGAD